eukprot:1384576-Pyramimonas_sp.AAC.1
MFRFDVDWLASGGADGRHRQRAPLSGVSGGGLPDHPLLPGAAQGGWAPQGGGWAHPQGSGQVHQGECRHPLRDPQEGEEGRALSVGSAKWKKRARAVY